MEQLAHQEWIGKALIVVVVFAFAFAVQFITVKTLRRIFASSGGEHASIVVNLARALIWALALLSILRPVFGIEPTAFMAALGVTSIVISFGLQDTIANIIGGIILMGSRVIRIGDVIKVGEAIGTVKDINWRSTCLERSDGNIEVIPNLQLSKTSLTKFINTSTHALESTDKVCIGVMGAMAEEVELLVQHMEQVEIHECAQSRFVSGTLSGKACVVVACGIGKIAAASCAQLLIQRFGVSHLIFTGVAGALDESIEIGDFVISTDCVQHDIGVLSTSAEPGQLGDLDAAFKPIKANDELRHLAEQASRRVAPDASSHSGRIATGDQFIVSSQAKQVIKEKFGALCCEMEGAAVAQVAQLSNIPFVIVRTISDKADGSAEADFKSFLPSSAKRCAQLVEHMIEDIRYV